MILQALARYYQRLTEQGAEDIAPYGYSLEKISYVIVLAPDGDVVAVNDIRDTSERKPRPRALLAPQPPKRSSGIAPCFLWDKTSYVLGVSNTSKRADREHEAFKTLHEAALADEEDAGLQALRAFLRRWTPEEFKTPLFPPEILDANVVFRLDGEHEYLHDRAAAHALCARLQTPDDGQEPSAISATCLVSGEHASIERLHPSIKGVNGAQSSGASLVSFNHDSFRSYGKDQGDNAPVSRQAAFAYTSALNYLLRRGEHNHQRLQIGDATVVFWAEAKDGGAQGAVRAEGFFAALLQPPDDASEAQRIKSVLDRVAQGHPLTECDPGLAPDTHMYVLGLAPNASRLSIRFWLVGRLDTLTERLIQHRKDLRLDPLPWKTEPSIWRLALATAPSRDGRAKSEDVPPQLAGELMRAILTGQRYPGSLLANMVMRMRADGDISGVRVAICKAVLARNLRIQHFNEEEIPVSLNRQSTDPGYLLGRLFAVLENVQRAALGKQVNATIRDRYYGAASATPASIFPVLLRNTQNHLGKLRKEKPGLVVNLEKEIQEIIDGLPEYFLKSLKIEAQGQFAIGYYHQSQAHFTKRDAGDADRSAPGDEPETTTQGALL
ncbi:MAG: type I-C CRISPR-associated protein Cas8c/Csd1 [Azoarcus sp.]|jgi:CRISPR-associated protein Csd1|nr:type I-C CRISPR-associated protein Cas8c/Csd1 [Azoarcus sp.]